MENQHAILACVEQTMVADAKIIKKAEQQLYEYQRQPGFTTFLLNAVTKEDLPMNVRLSCAIYMKNKLQRSWDTATPAERIQPEEQQAIKDNIIQTLVKLCENNHLRPHLTESIRIILYRSPDWNLTSAIGELLSSGKEEYIYPGLLLLFEVCYVHRWDMADNRVLIDEVVDSIFPVIEELSSQLVNSTDYKSNELLYLILKSFKYACLNNYPQYFNNADKLNAWIQLHLFVCSKPLPKDVLELDVADRSLDKRVKVNKWGFGNLNKFIHRYSRSTKAISDDFVKYVLSTIVPNILETYFKVIELWGSGSLWLSESSLYYLVQFLEKCVLSDDLYPMIAPHLVTVVQNVVFPCLCADEQSVELLEDDPEEYTRRYFDMNKEGSTADVASTDFIYMLGHKRPETLQPLLLFVNEVFQRFSQDPNDKSTVYKQEGAMRIISTLSSFLDENSNEESVYANFIIPLLGQTSYPFLVARALETIAMYGKSFADMQTLSKLFELTYTHFMENECLPIKVEAADALKTLIISNPEIHQHISAQVPSIMDKLLKLSKEFEIDILQEVMEAFVERFADELTPFAEDLASNLAQQFLQLGQSLVENASGTYSTGDQDQEIQASALLQTMTTMVMSMNKVPLMDKFLPVVKFIIVNAQISFLTEVVDLMDSLALSSHILYKQFTPPIWEIFHDIMDSFQTYAMDYFESYVVLFETVVTYGFPQDQTFVEPFLQVLSMKLESQIDYDVESVLDILVFYALSMRDIPLFANSIKAAANEELELDEKYIVKVFLANISVKPVETLQITEAGGVTLDLLTKWFNCKFCSVFGIKLQILSILSLFKLPELPSCVQGFVTQFSDKLVTLAETLPEAIRKRDAMSKGEEGLDDLLEASGEDDYFEEYEDDLKETVLDHINAFEELNQFFTQIQSQDETKYQQIVTSLSEEKRHSLQAILDFVSQHN